MNKRSSVHGPDRFDDPAKRDFLPAMLMAVAEKFGRAVAEKLAQDCGGLFLYMPTAPREDHPIARAVGAPVLAFIIDRMGGNQRLEIPRGRFTIERLTRDLVDKALDEGRSDNEIARELGIVARSVRRRRKTRSLPPAEARRRAAETPPLLAYIDKGSRRSA